MRSVPAKDAPGPAGDHPIVGLNAGRSLRPTKSRPGVVDERHAIQIDRSGPPDVGIERPAFRIDGLGVAVGHTARSAFTDALDRLRSIGSALPG